jgi:H/ACA ribonucleoprotein complex subunit 4
MQELRRVRTGPFHERDSVTLHDLKDAVVSYREENESEQLLKLIKPRETILLDLPRVIIQDSAVDAVCHGAPLAIPGILQFDDLRRKGEPAAIFTRKGEVVALGEVVMRTNDILGSGSGIALKTTRVLMPLGTYDKGWKSKSK